MRVIFLNSCFVSKRKDYIEITVPQLRIGVASLASFLRESNISVSVLDPQAEKLSLNESVDRILSTEPDYLCFSAYTEEIFDADKIARAVKKQRPNITTIIGGYHVSALPCETLNEFKSFDIGVVGAGELPLTDVIRGEKVENISGIVYRIKKVSNITFNPPNGTSPPLDMLPLPAWDLYDLERYNQRLPVEPLRGCPFSCIFCFRTLGRAISYKSPAKIVDEIQTNIARYGIASFTLLAGTFPLDKNHGIKVCEEIIKRGLKIKWSSSTRVNTVDEELLTSMVDSGCEEISLGVESGDQNILDICEKGTTLQDVEAVVRYCKKIGIKASLNFILGLPFETQETVFKTFDFAMKLRRYSSKVNFAILTPFPGTEVFDMALNNVGGLQLKSRNWTDYGKQSGLALEHDNLMKGELLKLQAKFYLRYYAFSPLAAMKLFSVKRVVQLIKNFFNLYNHF